MGYERITARVYLTPQSVTAPGWDGEEGGSRGGGEGNLSPRPGTAPRPKPADFKRFFKVYANL